MSLTFASDDGWIISHSNYIDKVYSSVNTDSGCLILKFNDAFFDINTKYLRHNQLEITTDDGVELPEPQQVKTQNVKTIKKYNKRKRKRLAELTTEDLEQTNHIRSSLGRLLASASKERGLFFPDSKGDRKACDNNRAARLISEKFYSDSHNNRGVESLHGSNETDRAVIFETKLERYVFPERCAFYCYDVRHIEEKMDANNQFDFILLDPPWWNKCIRRKKTKCSEASYEMMYNEELAKIPVHELLKPDGVVAVWCTNAPSHLRSIFEDLFPAWGVTYRAKWYWVKITNSGETICEFNPPPGKQPYELLILASTASNTSVHIPEGKLIVSVPSAVHSHKPPLTEVMKSYLPSNPKCLELFARYLLPGWTSWGLEVLKFQHLSLYSIAKESDDENAEAADEATNTESELETLS